MGREQKEKKRDIEKPWVDEPEFKSLVEEKAMLFKKKLKGLLDEAQLQRLEEINKEVNKLRKSLKRKYFQEKFNDQRGNLRATWEVLGEALTGRKGKNYSSVCRYFTKDSEAITDGPKIAKGFCDFYCQVGPKLAARVPKEKRGSKDYMGPEVQDSLFLTPTTAQEVKELCQDLEPNKGAGWDGVSPRVIKGVAEQISGSLSRLYNCCMLEGYYPTCFKVARVVPVFKAEAHLSSSGPLSSFRESDTF